MPTLDDFTMIPSDGSELTADDDLASAVASLLEVYPAVEDGEPPVPFGRTPLFDFSRGRYVKRGGQARGGLYPAPDLLPEGILLPGAALTVAPGAVVFVSGLDALAQWVLTTIYSAQYAHRVFTDAFGMELPDSVLGEATEVAAAVSDWGDRLQKAVTVHDRVSSLDDFEASYNADSGDVTIEHFTVTTDQDDSLTFGPLNIAPFDLLGA